MDDLAFVSINPENMPSDNDSLKQALVMAGLSGDFYEEEAVLYLENRDGLYAFIISDLSEFEELGPEILSDMSPGVEIAGSFDDPVAVLLELDAVFKKAYPGSDFSTAYDE